MTYEEMRQAARQQPFEPFRIVLTTGATYDIWQPDLVMVGRRSVIIGVTSDTTQPAYDRTIKVDLFHVVGIEELPATPPSNGPATA